MLISQMVTKEGQMVTKEEVFIRNKVLNDILKWCICENVDKY